LWFGDNIVEAGNGEEKPEDGQQNGVVGDEGVDSGGYCCPKPVEESAPANNLMKTTYTVPRTRWRLRKFVYGPR
jgi:hypothetical protein